MIEAINTEYGIIYVPDTDEGQYWWLKTAAISPEDEMIELVCDMLRERGGGVAIDCGANFGCWSVPLGAVSDLVHAFEPQRCVLKCLEQTLAANSLPIVLHRDALGAVAGTTTFPDIDLDNHSNFGGVSEAIPHSEAPDALMYEVNVVALDDVIPAGEDVAFIKIDCEGAEQRIIRGAERLIRRCRPIMVVEADHPLTDTNALGNQIQALGYNVEILQDNNFIAMPV